MRDERDRTLLCFQEDVEVIEEYNAENTCKTEKNKVNRKQENMRVRN